MDLHPFSAFALCFPFLFNHLLFSEKTEPRSAQPSSLVHVWVESAVLAGELCSLTPTPWSKCSFDLQSSRSPHTPPRRVGRMQRPWFRFHAACESRAGECPPVPQRQSLPLFSALRFQKLLRKPHFFQASPFPLEHFSVSPSPPL